MRACQRPALLGLAAFTDDDDEPASPAAARAARRDIGQAKSSFCLGAPIWAEHRHLAPAVGASARATSGAAALLKGSHAITEAHGISTEASLPAPRVPLVMHGGSSSTRMMSVLALPQRGHPRVV